MMATSLVLFLLPVLFHSYKACPSIRFVKNESLTGMTSDAGLIAIETSQLRAECPVKCVRKTGCKSVFYDQTSGICRLHSKYFQQSDSGLITNAGFSYHELLCPGIEPVPIVPKGTVQLVVEGTLATLRVVCIDRHRFSGSGTATCFEDVDWPARGSCEENQWFDMTTPVIRYFPVPVSVGTKAILVGRAGTPSFYLNIKPPRNVTISLHANLIDGTITRKKKHLGSWGHFITETTNALMPPGSVFTLTVEFTSESELKGTVTGNSFYNFTYPVLVGLESIALFQVKDNISISEIRFEWP
ncbi:uncharacterized protein [Haliotis cracherodii]|uniref:uncharacterized protein n=1 Tax=Haliotis cracherodii TaxID=6455 RepID=UPI0039EAF78A